MNKVFIKQGMVQLLSNGAPLESKNVVALINTNLRVLTDRLGIQPQVWQEKNRNLLGILLQIPSGRVVQLQQLKDREEASGVTVLTKIDGIENMRKGEIMVIINDILSALLLSQENLSWNFATCLPA